MPSAYITEDAGSAVKKLFSIAKSIWRSEDNFRSAKAKVQRDNWNKYSSIARLSRDLIMSFPTVCSNVIDPKTATMINKAIERKNVTMIQMVAAAIHLQGYNGKDVISQIHSNMGINYNVDDYIDNILTFQQMYKESFADEGPIPYSVYSEAVMKQFQESLKHVYPINSFSEHSILDYEIRNGSQVIVSESNADDWREKDYKYKVADLWERRKERQQKERILDQKEKDREAKERQQEKDRKSKEIQQELDRKAKERQQRLDRLERLRKDRLDREERKADSDRKHKETLTKLDNQYALDQERLNWQREKEKADREYQDKRDKVNDDFRTAQFKKDLADSKHGYLKQQLLDTDVKKANELQPTLIVLRYQVADPNADSSNVLNYIPEEFVAGVKSRMIAVPSAEIIDRIIDMKKNGVSMANLVKATTKETSFTKDFLAGIEMAKIDAKRDSKLSKSNSIWRSLQARSNKSLLKRLTRSANNATAITTLVISSQEVELVKNNYDIDISNPRVAIEFMSSYNLMGLVIVDEQTEVASFIYDGDAYFEDMSFTALEKENNNVSTKQIVNLLNNRR